MFKKIKPLNFEINNLEIKKVQELYEFGNFKLANKHLKEIDVKALSDKEKEEYDKLNSYLKPDKLSLIVGAIVFLIPIILLIIYAGN